MTTATKDAIKASFMKQLNRKPLSKITVREIVDDCGINRNTFYYHFQDIPSLLEYQIQMVIDSIQVDPSSETSLMEGIRPTVDYMLEHKKIIMNLYNSLGKEMLLKGIRGICSRVVEKFITNRIGDREVSLRDMELLSRFQTAMMTGVLIDWLENQMSYDLTSDIARAVVLFGQGITADVAKGNKS